MLDKEKIRLSNRILTCKNEVDLALRRIKSDNQDLKFWRNELQAAEAMFHGFTQGELSFTACPSCGD